MCCSKERAASCFCFLTTMMLKPWQTPLNKAPSKRGEKEGTNRENPSQSQKDSKNPKECHYMAKEQNQKLLPFNPRIVLTTIKIL